MNKFRVLTFVGCCTPNIKFVERKTFLPFTCEATTALNNLYFIKRFYAATRISESQLRYNFDLIEAKQGKISVKDLVYMPYDCTIHRKEHELIQYLNIWWNLVEPQLNNMYSSQVTSMLYGLEKINHICNGNVVKTLSLHPISKLTARALDQIATDLNYTPRCLILLLAALKNFSEDTLHLKDSIILSKIMESKLPIAITNFFADDSSINRKFNVEYYIGQILFYSASLGMAPPANPALDNIIKICINSFELSTNNKVICEKLLGNSNRIGTGFLKWKLNVDNEFWLKYLQSVQRNFFSCKTKERFYAHVLRKMCEIGLTFCLEIFTKPDTLQFWQEHMVTLEEHLQKNEINSLLDLCMKQFNEDIYKIESIFSPNILHKIMKRTDGFKIKQVNGNRRMIIYSGVLLELDDQSLSLPSKIAYCSLCDQIVRRNEAELLSCRVLSRLPTCALKYSDARCFVKDVFEPWWSLFKLKLGDGSVPGYRLSHSLYYLHKLDVASNGALAKKLKLIQDKCQENPVENLAFFVLEDVENEDFSVSTFSSTLASVIEFKKTLHFSTEFYNNLTVGCNRFFRKEVFAKKKYKDPDIVVEILSDLVQLDVKRPLETILKVMLQSCTESLHSTDNKENIYHYLWGLSKMMSTFVKWKVDADKYHGRFWNELFQDVQLYLPKINVYKETHSIRLKRNLLKNVLLVALIFDKENDLELIRDCWQKETLSLLCEFKKGDVQIIFAVAKEYGKYGQLEQLMSKTVYNKFKELA